MQLDKYSLVLASKSPRRRQLLGWLNVPFAVEISEVCEKSAATCPVEIARDIARLKGLDVFARLQKNQTLINPLIVASDTIVTLDDKIFGKPSSRQHARKMLQELANRTHQVITAVFICFSDIHTGQYRERVFHSCSKVSFTAISEDIMENYLDSGESLDKAGAYGIQGPALSFISRVDGSYSNVVGFPLDEFLAELKTLLEGSGGSWRSQIA